MAKSIMIIPDSTLTILSAITTLSVSVFCYENSNTDDSEGTSKGIHMFNTYVTGCA